MQLSTYLNFNGQCEAAFKYYEQCLGGKIEMMMTHGDSPMAEQTPPEWRDKIMHARLLVGKTALMGSDAPPQRYEKPQGFAVALAVDSPSDAERIFQSLVGKWDGIHAAARDILGRPFWNACGSIQHSVDDQLRQWRTGKPRGVSDERSTRFSRYKKGRIRADVGR